MMRVVQRRYGCSREGLTLSGAPLESFTVMLMWSSIRMALKNDIVGTDFR